MEKQSLPTSLPLEFQSFFWDIDAAKLDPSKHAPYVINRLLDKGNVEAVRWVRQSFPEELIIETVKTRRDFSPWTAVFWARFYDIPREEVRCLQEPYLTLRKQLWPY